VINGAAHPPPDLPLQEHRCWRCGSLEVRVYWQQAAGGRRAVRVDCARCGRFITFAPQTPANVALAEAARPEAGAVPGRPALPAPGLPVGLK
jgi:hypothetical protein